MAQTRGKHRASSAVGGFVNPASGYKGVKRAAMDAGVGRKGATAISAAANFAPTPAAPLAQLGGKVYQASKSYDEGAVKAFRATNSPGTQARKNSARGGIAGASNLTVRRTGGTGSVGKKKYH